MKVKTKKFGITFQVSVEPDPNYQPINWSAYTADDIEDLKDGLVHHVSVFILSEKNGQCLEHSADGVLLPLDKDDALEDLNDLLDDLLLEEIMRSWQTLERGYPEWKKP